MDKYLWVFLGGGVGSMIRFALSNYISSTGSGFPWATLAANAFATLVLAIVLAVGWTQLNNERAFLFIAIGLCGGFSTFSTFSKEVALFLEQQQYIMALSYVFLSIVICISIFISVYLAAGQWRSA